MFHDPHQPTKILLIEDDPAFVQRIERLLADTVAPLNQLEHRRRLSTGLDRASAGDIALILLDLSLPDLQGFDIFSKESIHAAATTAKQSCRKTSNRRTIVHNAEKRSGTGKNTAMSR